MVGHATVEKESERYEVDYEKIQSDDFTKLSKVVDGRYLLSINGSGLNQLSTVYEFSQIRFRCNKPYHGRTLDIKTTTTSDGIWARDWLLHRRTYSPRPPSCGSYARLPEDTSYLGANCQKWNRGLWYVQHLYDYPMFARVEGLEYYVNLEGGRSDYCDDNHQHPHYSTIGHWSYYVR